MENCRSGTIKEQNKYVNDDSEHMSMQQNLQQNLQHDAGWSEDEYDVSHISMYSCCIIYHVD
jgi:hypothetical protein